MIRGKLVLALVLFLLALAAPAYQAPAQTLKGLWYEDPIRGFRFRIPRDYAQVPLQEEERWTVALFQSEKEYTGSVKDGDSGWGHKPMLKVILFDEEAVQRNSAIELGGGTRINVGRAYRDYKDYVRINRSAGGYYFEQEEEGTVSKIPVTQYEVKIEKGARDRMRYIAWVFHGDEYDFALEVDVLEAQYRKLRNTILSSFKSFKFIPREEVVEAVANAVEEEEDDKPWDEMSVDERRDWRIAQEEKREARLRAKLPDDWKVTKTDKLLVMTHAGNSYTRNIIAMAEACRNYMDDRFGGLSDEHVRRNVIRICRDADEYIAYATGGSVDSFFLFAFGNGEITDFSESAPSLRLIFNGVFWHYLSEKLGSAYFDIPYWLQNAFRNMINTAQLKGRRLVFEPIASEKAAFAELVRDNREGIKTPFELMQLNSREISQGYEKEYKLAYQFLALLRFIEGPGQRHKLLKDRDFLLEYMEQVIATTEEFEKKNKVVRTTIKEATTEEEEERLARERQQRMQESRRQAEERQTELLAEVTKAACPWTAEEWEDLNDFYMRFWRSY